MRFGKSSEDQGDAIPLAPLIDIVFLTLVFFMTTAVFTTLESEIDITLPTAETAEERAIRTQGEIYINLQEDGSVVLNNRELTLDELQEVLYRVAEYFPGGSVIIRADRAALVEHWFAVVDSCRKADIQNISFAALRDEAEPAGDPS